MHIIRRPDWHLPESAVTPEPVWRARRRLLAAGAGALAMAALPGTAARAEEGPAPFSPLPARNPDFADAGRAVTEERLNASYNNFYEFGSSKAISGAARRLVTDPWSVRIDGLVARERTVALEDLLKAMPLEERIYRHRCVEAWSMVVPWIGFPLAALVAWAEPLSSARFVRFETFLDPDVAPGQRQHWYPWPYVEGVTIEEAANPLPLMVVGAYGKMLHNAMGAPLRLHLPWKYGFKSIKSIVRVSFTDTRPVGFWEELQGNEYGFWANVNPDVPHPRWSQRTERVLGTDEVVPTVIYNGYGPQVAHLYRGREEGREIWF
ncbi:MAG: protein-methionine-sulfoxide reductase catalytic subunit MsrP [Alphaproteobacteria bacterium]|nr:MAG: protein-methionine-sulfoxide reductase catalytic subunit MsrP [Alphaproteobacteria bacterium]